MRIALLAATAALTLLAACKEQSGNETNVAEANTANAAAAAQTASLPTTPPPTKEAALKLMHDRHENMEDIGDATKAIGRALKSDSPDLAVIREAAATYSRLAPDVASWFPPQTGPDVGKTRAKPAIWEKPQDFAQKTRDFQVAAAAFDAAAKSGDVAAIKASFGELGKACKACHDPYRAPESDH